MTAPRSTKEARLYDRQRRESADEGCPFCAIHKGHPQYVEETQFLKVIRNRMPYSIWDGQGVLSHLMIIPKKHVDKLGSLDGKAAAEFIRLVDTYESAGYNIYARAPISSVKSVEHQHTHLIQLDGKDRRFIVVLRKPFYIRLSLK
jgi:diadenosine tetraphosphate (Ap4A) HIT family hydrolase